jgi:hypothetical protein
MASSMQASKQGEEEEAGKRKVKRCPVSRFDD